MAAIAKEFNSKKSIILFGKTGHGKSSTGNTILRRPNAFASSDSAESLTKYCRLESNVIGDMLVQLVDTPGLMDTNSNDINKSNEDILQNIFSAMSLSQEGFNALVYVISYNQKFTAEEKRVLYLLKESFGESFVRDFCIVVMTVGDLFDLKMEEREVEYTFDQWLNEQIGPPEFLTLLSECEKRVVLFYNVGRQYTEKREQSLRKFWELVNSRPGAYTSEHFERCVKQRNTIVAYLKLPTQTQFCQMKLCLGRQCIQKVKGLMVNSTQLKDKSEVENNNKSVQTNLNLLKSNMQDILGAVKEADNETGVMKELIEAVEEILKNIDETKESSDKQCQSQLEKLDANLKILKETGSEQVHERFAVTGERMAAGAAVGSTIGLAVGLGSLKATVAAAAAATAATATSAAVAGTSAAVAGTAAAVAGTAATGTAIAASTAASSGVVITGGAALATILPPVVVIGLAGATLAYFFKWRF